jgi:hypothetical protein
VTGYHHVRQHTRRNGTRVRGYDRRNPSRAETGAGGAILILLLILVVLHGPAGHGIHSARFASHGQETAQTSHKHHSRAAQRPIVTCGRCQR